MTRTIVNSEDVIGVDVRNPQNESLGKIESLMLDKLNGRVVYVVLSSGGFLGMGNKLFAMPWSIFSYDKDKECFVIGIDKAVLKNAPSFEGELDTSHMNWDADIQNYYKNIAGTHRDFH